MADKITLVTFGSLANDTTATSDLNQNFATIVSALDNTLSRDGTSPNQMGATLDMNSNRIINLPVPLSNFDAVRFADITSLGSGGSITVNPLPTGGTAGQVLTKNSSTNFDASWLSPTVSVTPGKTVNITNSLTFSGSDSTTITFQGTDVYVSRQSIDNLSNKTINFGINGNVLQITSQGVTGVTGTGGLLVMSSGATINSPSLSGTISGTPTFSGTNFIGLTNLVTEPAWTLIGNNSSITSTLSAFTIGGLTQKVSPAASDLVMIQDQAAGGALKFATVAAVGVSSGVGSLGGATGTITVQSPGLTMTSNNLINSSVAHVKTATFTTDANSTTSTVYHYRAVGGGGGGGAANAASNVAGGGGSGAYVEGVFSGVAPSATVTIAIGAAGTAGAAGGAGGNGGTTSISGTGFTTIQAGGGGGGSGTSVSISAGGSGGTVGTGSPALSCSGGQGGTGLVYSSAVLYGGYGAASAFGQGGAAGATTTTGSSSGLTANCLGAGGGGGVGNAVGGAGAAGGCLITYWL